ncbi:vacuolar fusion protein MON1 homolog A [Culex pipiens pallens]|uniref:vacuolar fusion protein MON1 homolog A n=1 Tax=Culex pipiens pallens TaxID=42434 RepID=UPI001953DA46|nr:vacuolar fusion protein MON1 homolog A [Culex pipiens pallens]
MSGATSQVDIGDAEPGSCQESMLITTDSIEEFSQEISTSLVEKAEDGGTAAKDQQNGHDQKQPTGDKVVEGGTSVGSAGGNITKIQDGLNGDDKDSDGAMSKSSSFSSAKSRDLTASCTSLAEEGPTSSGATTTVATSGQQQSSPGDGCDLEDYLHDPKFLNKKRHVFILSSAGKPIYSMHGCEDKLATLFGVMQALVSFVQSNNDAIKSIHAMGVKFVFLVKSPLILVAISRTSHSVQQIQLQLTDVYNQILSTLTLSHMQKTFEKRKNFDLRRLLAGSERLIDHLLVNDKCDHRAVSNNPFSFMTHSVRILPLAPSVRETIIGAIQSNCAKIKNLVFAVLIANNKLIALVRMKKYFIHPADLRLIFNLIECSESFKSAESWTPICLPKFDSSGFLHAHVSYLAEDCQACLLLLSIERDVFFVLSEAKRKITDKLRRSNCLESINDAMHNKGIKLQNIGIPEIRHFVYKSKSNAQLLCSELTVPYSSLDQFKRLEGMYFELHHRIHNSGRPVKLIYQMQEKEILLAWVTQAYELFAAFEPTVHRNDVINLVNKLLKWIKKEENSLFILSAPTF